VLIDDRARQEVNFDPIRSSVTPNPMIPTGDRRHIASVRDGAQSSEVWSRAQRMLWHEEWVEENTTVKDKRHKEKNG
jgi:hypothetical protein